MIGTRVSCTVWHVHYRYLNQQPERRVLYPGERAPEQPKKFVAGELVVVTADPTGSDLCDVARLAVLGAAGNAAHEFSLTHVHRVADARGLASVQGEAVMNPLVNAAHMRHMHEDTADLLESNRSLRRQLTAAYAMLEANGIKTPPIDGEAVGDG